MGIDKVSQWCINCDDTSPGCIQFEEVIEGDSGVFNKAQAIKEFRIRGWKIGERCLCKYCSSNAEEVKDD